jgi:hypothetical protein
MALIVVNNRINWEIFEPPIILNHQKPIAQHATVKGLLHSKKDGLVSSLYQNLANKADFLLL